MGSGTTDLNIILERIRELEVQNRRLKKWNVVILTSLCVIILMGQAMPSPHVVEAQKFVLKDAEGNVRGWMGTIGKGSELNLGNVNAQPMMRFVVGTDSSLLHLFGSHQSGMSFGLDSGTPDISIVGAEGTGAARVAFGDFGPSLTLTDAKGLSAAVGAVQFDKLTSGKARQPSAASLLLLDQDKKIIWQAPGNRDQN